MKKTGAVNLIRVWCVAYTLVAGQFTGALAAEWEHAGMAEPGRWTSGFRVGPSFITQDSFLNTAGPAVNVQGLYGPKSRPMVEASR